MLSLEEDLLDLRRLQDRFEDLCEFRRQVEAGLTQERALESEVVLGNNAVLEAFYSDLDATKKHSVALEGIITAAIAVIIAVFVAVSAVIYKVKKWLKKWLGIGEDKEKFTGTDEQIAAIHKVVKDPELIRAVKTIEKEGNDASAGKAFRDKNYAAEDFRNPDPTSIYSHFEAFKNELTDNEVDFLTSGQKTKMIREAVSDFSASHYGKYVSDLGKALFKWTDTGLEASKHVGKDDGVVKDFVIDQQRKLDQVKHQYAHHTTAIFDMEKKYGGAQPAGSRNQLYVYYNRPSELFPALERIWNELGMNKLGGEERTLLKSLDELYDHYEKNIKTLKERQGSRERPWPPEEEMLKLACKAHREIIEIIKALMTVANFIRNNTNTAYTATNKCFNYIFKVLTVVNKMQYVDRAQLGKCIEILKSKRDEIGAIAGM